MLRDAPAKTLYGKTTVIVDPAWALRLSIVLTCIAAYVPSINNSFISDDFTLIRFLEALRRDPGAIWYWVSELFRAVSYVYYSVTFALFGLRPELHYGASIALHTGVCLLVFALTRAFTSRDLTAWVAAMFFAAYARHEEAVMWISANNSTLITMNSLVFLLLWERSLAEKPSRAPYRVALGVFVIALFSKETSLVLAPLAMLRMRIRGYSPAEISRRTWPLAAICAAFVFLWLSQAKRNFFVTDGHYAAGFHFFTVYARSLLSLLSSAIPFVAGLLIASRCKRTENGTQLSLRSISQNPDCVFFLIWILLALLPVSFLTYSKYIPSRNTYLPSIALAALVGIFFTVLIDNVTTVRAKRACGLLLAAVLAWNVAYLWRKQDAEYVKRAAPTRELIAVLSGMDLTARTSPVVVCGFPLDPSIAFAAIATFTKVDGDDVRFPGNCRDGEDVFFARWDEAKRVYVTAQRHDFVPPGARPEVPQDAKTAP